MHIVHDKTDYDLGNPQELFTDAIPKDHSNMVNKQAFVEIETGLTVSKIRFTLDMGQKSLSF